MSKEEKYPHLKKEIHKSLIDPQELSRRKAHAQMIAWNNGLNMYNYFQTTGTRKSGIGPKRLQEIVDKKSNPNRIKHRVVKHY